uniref:Alpha/beta hydrolase fold-5 domain-containing protein n=1 Tax=Chryseobacterium endophyticum TaxID=1854762 RepID=A0AAU6WNH7_9FLAO
MGLYRFIAKKGFVVVFVPYRTIDISVDHRYQTLWQGFVKAANDYPNIIDTKKVGFMGHSFGGGASIDLAYKAFTEKGWGQDARFLLRWHRGMPLTGTARLLPNSSCRISRPIQK